MRKRKQFLVTDPCYVVPDSEWDNFLKDSDFGIIQSFNEPYHVEGIGNIVESKSTENGDGSILLTHSGKQVGVDSGLVCIVELEEDYEISDNNGNAVTDKELVARKRLERASKI